jgi:tetratricopeptide (TPR) repeat protein
LRDLFAVTHDSPGYNESEHQGIFYAQSWLLAHYLMLGDNPARKARFGQLTAFLRRGQSPEGAFTNAFLASLPVIENELRDYLNRGKFEPCTMSAMNADLTAPQPMATHGVGSAEVAFRLGDQLLRVGRLEEAEHYFDKAQVLAPKSPLSYEGRGLLAAKQGQSSEAVRFLGEALQRGSTSFLAHYLFAREKYQLSTDTPGRHTRIEGELAGEIRKNLEQAVALMPDFGPAHELLGFFEMVQRDNLVAAEQHLGRAIELEPDNHAYRFSMAQALVLKGETEPARRILEGLSLPYIEPQLRAEAEGLIQKINELKKN